MIRHDRSPAPTRVHVVLNWTEELKRLVPTDKLALNTSSRGCSPSTIVVTSSTLCPSFLVTNSPTTRFLEPIGKGGMGEVYRA